MYENPIVGMYHSSIEEYRNLYLDANPENTLGIDSMRSIIEMQLYNEIDTDLRVKFLWDSLEMGKSYLEYINELSIDSLKKKLIL